MVCALRLVHRLVADNWLTDNAMTGEYQSQGSSLVGLSNLSCVGISSNLSNLVKDDLIQPQRSTPEYVEQPGE